MLADPRNRPAHADQLQAKLIWMHDDALLAGRTYIMKLGTATTSARVTRLKYRIDVNTLEHSAATRSP